MMDGWDDGGTGGRRLVLPLSPPPVGLGFVLPDLVHPEILSFVFSLVERGKKRRGNGERGWGERGRKERRREKSILLSIICLVEEKNVEFVDRRMNKNV